jgi:type III secretion system chaperone SycN
VSWVHETLADFGRQMGLPSLDFGAHGVAQLQMQSGGLLAVEPVKRGEVDEVLVYLGRPTGFDSAGLLRKALVKAHHSAAGALPVQVALRGDAPESLLLMLVRVPERDFTLQSLGQSVDYLGRWFESLGR